MSRQLRSAWLSAARIGRRHSLVAVVLASFRASVCGVLVCGLEGGGTPGLGGCGSLEMHVTPIAGRVTSCGNAAFGLLFARWRPFWIYPSILCK